MSSLSVAEVHVTTVVSLQRQQPATSTSSSGGGSGGGGEEEEFDVIINQSHYELYQPPLASRDVTVYVIQLVCIHTHVSYHTRQVT